LSSIERKKIAIIGTGISGLGAASLLHPHHDITVYEKNSYVGGHSRTVTVPGEAGDIPVDTGFIVFNNRNYPLLTRLFAHLEVPVARSDMSFGVSVAGGWLEYGTRTAGGLIAQKRNLIRPAFWRMLRDILTFNSKARTYLEADPDVTLGDCLDELGMGRWFRDYYLLAMGGAIWSTPVEDMLDFPAQSFIRFFDNHGLLTVNDHPEWSTVKGGSREYVRRLIAPFEKNIRLDCGVNAVQREEAGGGVIISDSREEMARYDEVVFACHADQALRLMADATGQERDILSAFRYQPNRAVLHGDTRFLPSRRAAWSSWVYLSDERADTSPAVSLSYWMNNLQPLPTDQTLIVTLNPGREPDPAQVYDDFLFDHPVFDAAALRAQKAMPTLQGRDRYRFCGAWLRYGFHEDALASAVAMAEDMGIQPSW
jgi:predicted NAD/FAD-binding protein